MLTLTENARDILTTLANQPGADEVSALRISVEDASQNSYAVAPADQPEADDQVVEDGGAKVYLDPDAAEQLDDKVLDAAVDSSGNLQFGLDTQG